MSDNATISESWSAQDYITHRLDDQQKYHSNKSKKSQKLHKWLRWIEIIAAAMIPLVAIIYKGEPELSIIVGSFGALVAVLAGLLALGKYDQEWFHHRMTSEALKSEKIKFLMRCGEYADDSSDASCDDNATNDQKRQCKLTENVEQILDGEHQAWQKLKRKKDKKAEKK